MNFDELDLSYFADEVQIHRPSGLCHWNSCCQHILPVEQYDALAREKLSREKLTIKKHPFARSFNRWKMRLDFGSGLLYGPVV